MENYYNPDYNNPDHYNPDHYNPLEDPLLFDWSECHSSDQPINHPVINPVCGQPSDQPINQVISLMNEESHDESTASCSHNGKSENRTESLKLKRDRKRHDHCKYRLRKNEALTALNSALDKLCGNKKRSLIEALRDAAAHLNASEE